MLFVMKNGSLVLSPMTIFFFFNDTATTEIYTLSLHDALPICRSSSRARCRPGRARSPCTAPARSTRKRSEEHTSELQSLAYLVCRLLLEKKKVASPFHCQAPLTQRCILVRFELLDGKLRCFHS